MSRSEVQVFSSMRLESYSLRCRNSATDCPSETGSTTLICIWPGGVTASRRRVIARSRPVALFRLATSDPTAMPDSKGKATRAGIAVVPRFEGSPDWSSPSRTNRSTADVGSGASQRGSDHGAPARPTTDSTAATADLTSSARSRWAARRLSISARNTTSAASVTAWTPPATTDC